ncbi:MAG: glycine betaine ABC transporter substrate-binding protein [Actinomycetota bacterium]|nr:glycine betaine ABC transporter substrate-binding protein [Actinomycetota bacterium]
MKASRKLLAVILALVASILVAGCGGSGGGELTIGDIGWDESVAVSNLTKHLLEQDLGYQRVELETLDVAPLFEGVRNGDLDAFQDVWIPNHRDFINEARNDIEQFDPWYQGRTEFGLAAPSYMNLESIDDLGERTDVTQILGIEPGAVIMRRIDDNVIPEYGLNQEVVESSTPAMLAEVERLYRNQEPFVFIAWRPHWMNQRYDFNYLDDPRDALGELTQSAEISTIVREGLADDDPPAYAFLNALTLTEAQLNDLENTINEVGDPLEGARQWAEANRDVVQPWVDAAKNARQS